LKCIIFPVVGKIINHMNLVLWDNIFLSENAAFVKKEGMPRYHTLTEVVIYKIIHVGAVVEKLRYPKLLNLLIKFRFGVRVEILMRT